MLKWFVLIFLAILLPVYAVETPVFPDPVSEERYQAFTYALRCLKCEHQSVAESDSDFAKDVKHWVADAILAGRSDQEIKDMLQSRFGDRIFLDPPWQINTYLLWFLPILVCLLGIIIWLSKVRR